MMMIDDGDGDDDDDDEMHVFIHTAYRNVYY